MHKLVRESASSALHGSKVKYEHHFSPDLWNVEADEGQIGQVIYNLVTNADQAMPEGGTVVLAAENVAHSGAGRLPLKAGDYVRITVSDQGVGIPEEYREKIFDPYFTTKQKGSGLGLATCYSIIQRHEGLLIVESQSGKGTTFSVYLPASASTKPAA